MKKSAKSGIIKQHYFYNIYLDFAERRHGLKTIDLILAILIFALILTCAALLTLSAAPLVSDAPVSPSPEETEAPPAPTLTTRPSPSPAPSPSPTPDPSREKLLTLVNPWNSVPEEWEPELTGIYVYTLYVPERGEIYVDSCCFDDLVAMLDACYDAGGNPYICAGYRTHDYQQMLFNNKVKRVIEETGCDPDAAEMIAARSVAVPGTSEHELGLAVDIIDWDYVYLDEGQEDTYTQQWLMENCWDYGFILRYPNDKKDITGIIYEPWHYRYVGRELAAEIRDSGLCFEEYLESLS